VCVCVCGAGDWQIEILYDGRHVDGSPFTVRVYDPGQVKVSGLGTGVVGTAVLFASNYRYQSSFFCCSLKMCKCLFTATELNSSSRILEFAVSSVNSCIGLNIIEN